MIDYTLPLDQLPDPLPIEPLTRPFDVTITPPGSKSITCRAYVLAALAKGESRIVRPLRADDTDLLLKALCTLGAEARWDGEDVLIKGVAGRFPRGGSVNLGDGGTPTRFMIACACLAAEPVIVDGSKRMRERPIAEGVEMLRQLGARIEYVEEEGRLPVRVVPGEAFTGGNLQIGATVSSQFISAVMLIAPCLANGLRLKFEKQVTSRAYVGLTANVLGTIGVRVRYPGENVPLKWVAGSARDRGLIVKHYVIKAFELKIAADWSSTIYWMVATALRPHAHVQIPNAEPTGSQPDAQCVGALIESGAWYAMKRCELRGCEPRQPFSNDSVECPDGAVALAAYASTTCGTCRLTGLHTLRVKETDRIAALANELRKVGCTIETGEDWIAITPPHAVSDDNSGGEEDTDRRGGKPSSTERSSRARSGSSSRWSSDPASKHSSTPPVIIETYNDHRMAMAFAVLGLARPGISIRNPACVAKSYPGFWKDFAKLYQ